MKKEMVKGPQWLTGMSAKEVKIEKIRIEHEIASIRDRIRDIEWQIQMEVEVDDYQKLIDERRKALDKLRKTTQELLEINQMLIRSGDF